LFAFLVKAITISLSGVLAPGPMTAATLAAGMRSRHAGAIIALGHAAVEFPLMALIIVAGERSRLFQNQSVKLAIGAAGGAILLVMGAQLLAALRKTTDNTAVSDSRSPFVTGVVLTAANPYFLIWWATVGLALATEAATWGMAAFALFAVLHWLCDLVWLEALSFASHKGTQLLGNRLHQGMMLVCGVMLLVFGCMFLYDAGSGLWSAGG